jgi:hypothetical protein
MGAQQPQKPISKLIPDFLDPNVDSTATQKSDDKILRHIKDAFRNCATNGLLTKNQFNQALAVL